MVDQLIGPQLPFNQSMNVCYPFRDTPWQISPLEIGLILTKCFTVSDNSFIQQIYMASRRAYNQRLESLDNNSMIPVQQQWPDFLFLCTPYHHSSYCQHNPLMDQLFLPPQGHIQLFLGRPAPSTMCTPLFCQFLWKQ